MNNSKNTKQKAQMPKQKKKKTTKKTTVKMIQRMPQDSLMLSPCVAKFALACSDPFNPDCFGACIPMDSYPSQKLKALVRGTAFVGDGGLGFIAITPTLASNLPCIYYTQATFLGTTSTILTATNTQAVGVANLSPNAGYAAANLLTVGNPLMGRIVSAGIKCNYIGTTLNLSGQYIAKHDPEHDSVIGSTALGLAPSDLTASGYTRIENITRAPFELPIFPCISDESSYTTFRARNVTETSTVDSTMLCYPFTNGIAAMNTFTQTIASTIVAPPIAIIWFSGVPGESFSFEYIQHMEYAGTTAVNSSVAGTTDPQGTQMVMAAAKSASFLSNSSDKSSQWQKIRKELVEVFKAAKPVLIPIAEKALTRIVAMI